MFVCPCFCCFLKCVWNRELVHAMEECCAIQKHASHPIKGTGCLITAQEPLPGQAYQLPEVSCLPLQETEYFTRWASIGSNQEGDGKKSRIQDYSFFCPNRKGQASYMIHGLQHLGDLLFWCWGCPDRGMIPRVFPQPFPYFSLHSVYR